MKFTKPIKQLFNSLKGRYLYFYAPWKEAMISGHIVDSEGEDEDGDWWFELDNGEQVCIHHAELRSICIGEDNCVTLVEPNYRYVILDTSVFNRTTTK